MMELPAIQARVRERFPELAVVAGPDSGELTVPGDRLIEVMTFLRDELDFAMLTDVTAVDWLPREPRFDVVYHLLSISNTARLRVHVEITGVDDPQVTFGVDVWSGVDWCRRAVSGI